MPTPHRRCCYMNDQGLQCETWFPALTDSKLCDDHSGIVSPSRNGTDSKVKYIDLVNNERAICFNMTTEELDSHIASLEKVLEEQKARVYAARATKAEKLDALTEEERKELRKLKVTRAVTGENTKKETIKSNPVAYLMKSKGMSQSDAKDLLNMDMDALLAKFEEAKKNK